ncbi:MAG: lipoprotein 17-related variable surface protein, partial [Phocaeicola sp.]
MKKIKPIYTAILLFCLFACNPVDLKTDDSNEMVPEETKDAIPPTINDLLNYFSLSQQMNIGQVSERVNSVRGKKTINSKEIDIQEVTSTSQNEDLGTLSIQVKGTVNSVKFSADYKLEGFVKKPTDYQMASRTLLKWKESYKDAPYLIDIAFDELYR